jgi:hypothetical protein
MTQPVRNIYVKKLEFHTVGREGGDYPQAPIKAIGLLIGYKDGSALTFFITSLHRIINS